IKAVAGGGGKGMRKVDAPEDFPDALESCQREAASSFDNDVMLIEKWIESPRHIEVQVFGDSHGNVVHLFERDCSLQRRHQKVIEEAPAPGMDAATREAVCGAAVKAAQAVNYEGAGTIEFIADASDGLRADRIWFMEMNTRLQVEHPVTEEITGVDLVEWQLRVASGEKLPLRQDELSINGHAIEARLYAEDPSRDFLPSVGRLEKCHLPEEIARVETGFEAGSEVSAFYDPMLAKVIVHAATRPEAILALTDALEGTAVWPIKSNAGFLWRAVNHPAFHLADLTTSFITDHAEELRIDDQPSSEMLRQAARELVNQYALPGFNGLNGFRLNASAQMLVRMSIGPKSFEVIAPEDFGGEVYSSKAARDVALVTENGVSLGIALDHPRGTVGAAASDGAILAPMPGKVTSVEVATGETVDKGQRLLTLEAMKMEHGLVAPFDGVIAELNTSAGEQVQVDAVLAKIEKASS
ncbi:MAG: methylcrotonoyl-CoA carboxylase, partial [Pseudomonadota bacterium]|nr:methylcrotonoyl-CoA carboxylase [Pseudomonadota bacterium]